MAVNITEEHLHHMARKHHATMRKLDGLRDKFGSITQRAVSTIEHGAGAFIGGALEGKTNGASLGPVPINLGIGALLLVAGHLDLAGPVYSEHLNNIGNGFVGSYLAATGYSFGKRWADTGKLFGGGGHPWTQPYGSNGWSVPAPSAPPPAINGDLDPAQMAAIVQRMQAAAQAPTY
jgi:hypothetical protein